MAFAPLASGIQFPEVAADAAALESAFPAASHAGVLARTADGKLWWSNGTAWQEQGAGNPLALTNALKALKQTSQPTMMIAQLALNDITDVDIPSPADGEVVVYDAATSRWTAQQYPGMKLFRAMNFM